MRSGGLLLEALLVCLLIQLLLVGLVLNMLLKLLFKLLLNLLAKLLTNWFTELLHRCGLFGLGVTLRSTSGFSHAIFNPNPWVSYSLALDAGRTR